MKHAIHLRIFCMLAVFALCMNGFLRAEEKTVTGGAPETELGQVPPMPPPPPGEHTSPPFGQQFNVRGRIHALLENLQKNEPEEYQRLMQLRTENREEYLKELWKKMPERENDNRKKITDIDRKCRELGEKFQNAATKQEKDAIKAELSALLDQSMDLVVQDTKERLERVQKILDNLNNNRGKIIQQRLEQFLSGKPAAQRPKRPRQQKK